jgi:hypothetical protein
MQHHFTIEIASKYGLNCAILLDNFVFWQIHNETNKKNYFDGRYWTYNSIKAFQEQFPYLTLKQIRGAIQKLEDEGLIASGKYSDNPYDQTKWYSVEAQVMDYYKGQIDFTKRANVDLPSGANAFSQKGKSSIIQIENNTDNKQHIDKHPYGEFENVLLTDAELEKLKRKFPSSWERKIENLSEYIESKGAKYKSHYATILNWARKNGEDNEPPVLGVIHE